MHTIENTNVNIANMTEEQQYINLVKQAINDGVEQTGRNGATRDLFGTQSRYSLRRDVMPLLTTKRVFWRGVVEELLWFIRGDTSIKRLSEKGVHIWDAYGDDAGPIYGFQWRHFGATYRGCDEDYTDEGVDQLAQVIKGLKTEPYSRRHIITFGDPEALHDMVLPPCHTMMQFYVMENKLSCQLYQRSADLGLGVPFNIASYALLTRMIAKVCNLEAHEFVHTIGVAHVYENHVWPLIEQCSRTPVAFPTMTIDRDVKSIDDFKASDFVLHNYNPMPSVKLDLTP